MLATMVAGIAAHLSAKGKKTMTTQISVSIDPWADCASYVGVALDPQARTVYAFGIIGSGCPEAVYHSRHLQLLTCAPNTSEDALASWLVQHGDTIEAIAVCWNGDEHDGSNFVGLWSQRADDLCDYLQDEWENMPAATVTSAASWFEPAYSTVLRCALERGDLWASARSEVAEAAGEAILELSDVARTLRRMVAQYELDLLADFRAAADERDRQSVAHYARAIRMARALMETA